MNVYKFVKTDDSIVLLLPTLTNNVQAQILLNLKNQTSWIWSFHVTHHTLLLTRESVGRVTLSLPCPRLSLSVSRITWPSSLRITTCGSADEACTMGDPRSRGMCCTWSKPCSNRTPICDTCTPENKNPLELPCTVPSQINNTIYFGR